MRNVAHEDQEIAKKISTSSKNRHPFNGLLSWTTWVTWVGRHQKAKSYLDFNKARDNGVAVASAGPQYKSFAPCSRQIIMSEPHHSIFYRLDAVPDAKPTVSKN